MRNNVMVLLEQRARRLGKQRPALRDVAKEIGISYYTLNGVIQNSIREYPVGALTRMCEYFECNVGDILSYEEVTE